MMFTLGLEPGWQWNPGHAFSPICDSSTGCTYISELMFTLGLESSAVRFKRLHFIHLTTES
ncbi:unnamed protein product [Schistosoma margrebowiei]|uniref:Uncharacterized protein n=1 Tax=Schistosoma margrebowiei TaxID=48269 RepID=A0A3P7Y741_9TREM|nr:unnamed protein product [Schistosoma margrebowiei]